MCMQCVISSSLNMYFLYKKSYTRSYERSVSLSILTLLMTTNSFLRRSKIEQAHTDTSF